jgi:hypothetical protein
MKRNIFIDTEFIEETMELISIGIVKDTGETYYAVSNEFNAENASDWVKKNILATLDKTDAKSIKKIRDEIKDFLLDVKEPKFIGYFCAYDYVLWSKIFGSFDDYPKNYPMYFVDLKQDMDRMSFPKNLKPINDNEHHALSDALHIREMYDLVKKYELQKKLSII